MSKIHSTKKSVKDLPKKSLNNGMVKTERLNIDKPKKKLFATLSVSDKNVNVLAITVFDVLETEFGFCSYIAMA